ncbi:MAG: type I-E CRISPR-associated protein Cas6/Cse3/CasE [Gammaproteobacteria bacterium]|nr:type I-E CRISPR-associated protein Cas6/Cse3/CasE [Gammaproteobacteria bacterium]
MASEKGDRLMYLSRIQVAPSIAEHSQLGFMLKDRSYGIHRLLWDLFTAPNRYLYREESTREQLGSIHNLPLYYVLSETAPTAKSPIFEIESKPFNPVLIAGDQLAFRLRANPTVARKQNGDKKSKRHDVVMNAQRNWLIKSCEEKGLKPEGTKSQLRNLLAEHGQLQTKALDAQLNEVMNTAALGWLEKRGSSCGFQLMSAQATGYRWHALPEKSRAAGFSSMDYEGVLTIEEPQQFVKMMGQGLGPSKAFGCGLMLIRKI